MDPDDSGTWYGADRRGIMVEIYHHQTLWDNRTAPRVHRAFSQIWGTESVPRTGCTDQDAAEDVDEAVVRGWRQQRTSERREVGGEVIGVARAREDHVDARLVAAKAVGGCGSATTEPASVHRP